jgi:hypothetical protein
MQKIALALVALVTAVPALAAESKGEATPDNPMAYFKPPKVTREAQDKKEIAAVWKSMEAAQKKGDVNAAADLVDYPVLMMTDNSKGEGMGEQWTREKWIQVMEPFYKHPHPANMKPTHKTSIFLMSDSLASVNDVGTYKVGGKPVTVRSATLLVKKDGKWLVKAMAEGGWGDMPTSQPAAASQGTAPSGSESGTGASTGTGAAGQGTESGSSGTGAGTETPASPSTTK